MPWSLPLPPGTGVTIIEAHNTLFRVLILTRVMCFVSLCYVQFLVCVLFYARCGRSAPAARALRARCAGARRPRVRHLASLGAGPSGPLRALRARCGPSGPAAGASRPQGSLPGCLSLPGYPAGPGNLFARLPFYPAPTRLFRVAREGGRGTRDWARGTGGRADGRAGGCPPVLLPLIHL